MPLILVDGSNIAHGGERTPLIDNLDDKVKDGYNAWPDRLYLVGRDGRIGYKGAPGPGGFDPKGLEAAVKKELTRPAPPAKTVTKP